MLNETSPPETQESQPKESFIVVALDQFNRNSNTYNSLNSQCIACQVEFPRDKSAQSFHLKPMSQLLAVFTIAAPTSTANTAAATTTATTSTTAAATL